MKNSCLFLLLFALLCGTLSAQNPGCDGSRYLDDVFPTVKKTTVTYAPTVNHTGLAITLSMDVYEPQDDNLAKRPAVVLAHGGSFVFGDKSQMQRWCELLAKKGYVAASIQYRLYPVFVLGFPDSLDIFDTAVKAVGDMRAAVRYFREDAATGNTFRVDPDHIFVGGYSAGAVTALHCVYLDSNDAIPAFLQTILQNNGGLEGISGTPSNRTYPSASDAVLSLSGGLYRNTWIDADDSAPLLSIHGTADETVDYVFGLAAGIAYLQGSSLLHTQADLVGLPNFLQTVPGGGHTNIYENAPYQPFLDTFWLQATTQLEELVCAEVSAEELENTLGAWSISPNPSSGGALTLQLPSGVDVADLRLSDLQGRVVFEAQALQSGQTLALGKLPAGTYFAQILERKSPTGKIPPIRLILGN